MIVNYFIFRLFNIRIIIIFFEIFYTRKSILSYLRIIDFIVYAIKRIQKKITNKNKKYIFINYKNKNIFYLYNLI